MQTFISLTKNIDRALRELWDASLEAIGAGTTAKCFSTIRDLLLEFHGVSKLALLIISRSVNSDFVQAFDVGVSSDVRRLCFSYRPRS